MRELIAAFAPAAIVETGTFHATTTEHLAEAGLPVYTMEANHTNFGFALRRLIWRRNVTMRLCDSRAGLRSLFGGPLRRRLADTVFFYLDAHWNEDLPLAEEIDIIFTHCAAAIVLIDDFEVPGDAGYGFDDYGEGRALTAAYIDEQVRTHGLAVFYPSTPSFDESGARRGCAVLVKASSHLAAMSNVPLLRAPI